MKYAIALMAVAGLAASASAQSTRLVFEASNNNGATWVQNNLDVAPSQTVQIRVRVLLTGNTASVFGLAGITFQPTLTGASAADTRSPFTNEATGAAVAYADGTTSLGRITPFGSAGQGSSSASGLLTSFLDGGNTLRFAGSKATALTTNLAWGTNIGQLTPGIDVDGDGVFTPGTDLPRTGFASGTSATVFKFAVALSSATAARDLVASAPITGVLNSRGTWYMTELGASSLQAPLAAADIQAVTLHIVPAPASLALLGLGGLVAGRRRR